MFTSRYTVMSAGSQAVYPDIYGVNANAYVIPFNQVVEIVINNTDNGKMLLLISPVGICTSANKI